MKFEVPRGSWEPLLLVFRDKDGNPEDISNWIIHLTVGRNQLGTAELFRLRSDVAEECLVDGPSGTALFFCAESFTENLEQTSYWWDAWVRLPDGTLRRRGKPDRFEVGPRVRGPAGIPSP